MPTYRSKRWLPIPLLFLLAACTALFESPQQFETAQRDFTMRLRWMDFPGASRHLSPDLRDDFLSRLGGQDDLHVTDVRLESSEYLREENRMITWTAVEYYRLPSVVVQTSRLRQEWEYVGEDRFHSGNWQIVTPFPDLRAPVPPAQRELRRKTN